MAMTIRGVGLVVVCVYLTFWSSLMFAQENSPYSVILENRQWEQLVIPGNAEALSVETLFGDDLAPGNYGRTWIIYTYDAAGGELGTGIYNDPGLEGTLEQGQGFWMIQVTGEAVEIDVPLSLLPASLIQSEACLSDGGCVEIPITKKVAAQAFSMIGAPFARETDPAEIRVRTAPAVSLCAQGCTLEEAAAFGILAPEIWRYDSATNSYRDMLVDGVLAPMQSVWLRTNVAPGVSAVDILIAGEAVDDPALPPAAAFTASRNVITEGSSTTLRWNAPTADSVEIEPTLGGVENTGEATIQPERTTTYTLTATREELTTVVPLTITVQPLAAVSILASVTQGEAPLTVRFSPVLDSATAINRVYWDFEGDGGFLDGGLGIGENGFDFVPGSRGFDARGRDFVYIFQRAGTYITRARVWDADGNQSDATVTITVENGPPVGTLSVTSTYGSAPLDVTLRALATDANGIERYEWDFEGDGEVDSTTQFSQVRHIYNDVGTFDPTVRVFDSLGASRLFTLQSGPIGVVAEAVPRVTLSVSPATGSAPLSVFAFASFSGGSGSYERIDWDFDSDGVLEATTSATTSFTTHTYESSGLFRLTATVIDTNGAAGQAVFAVVVDNVLGLSVENDAIDPEEGEAAEISLRVPDASELTLEIVNEDNTPVRTLVNSQTLEEGARTFGWDGRNDAGQILPPGGYYVIARITANDQTTVLDLRDTTAGLIYYPPASDFGNCRVRDRGVTDCGALDISDNALEPFNNLPRDYDFSTPQNSKVTAYVTVQGREIFATANFFRSRPLPAGDYQIRWYADGTDGQILPPRTSGRGYVPAIYGLTAGENSIFLTHYTTLENLRVEPPIFHPDLVPGRGGNAVTFDLSRTSDVVMQVDSVDAGIEVRRQRFPGVSSGSSQFVQWDGRDNNGNLVAPGAYRISVVAQDEFGQESFTRRAMQRVRY